MTTLGKAVAFLRTCCLVVMAYGLVGFLMCIVSNAATGGVACLWLWSMPMLVVAVIDKVWLPSERLKSRMGG